MNVLRGADDDRLVDVALLDASARRGLLHRHDDDVADAGEAPLGAAQHLDALDALRAAIVGDVEVGLHLDHRSNSFFTSTAETLRRRPSRPRPFRTSSWALPCSPASPRPAASERR